MKLHQDNTFGALGGAIGKGLLAGIAATAVMTLSQMIEMKITKREASEAPLTLAKDTAGAKPATPQDKKQLSQELHWSYGTAWGVSRGLISLTGLKGWPATAVHFAAVWGTALIMLPKFNAAPPVTEEEPQAIAFDAFHHAVYAVTAGLVFDALDAGGRHERKFDKLVKQLRLKGLINKIKY